MNDDGIVSRASDLLHDLIDRVVVSFGDQDKQFDLLLEGNIVGMFSGANPPEGGSYARMQSSLKLVAGVGFEPTTFRL
ncbi:hypothetical protein ACSSVY_004329 [Roseovarius sp. MBR-51]